MEALGSVGSIIAVVQIAGSVAKLCGGYIADVKDARHDVERLQQKAETLREVLQKIARANDRTDGKQQDLSENVLKSVDQCSQDLEKLQEKLQPKKRHKTMSMVGLRALKWPLSKSSVTEGVRMIEGYLAVFGAALQLGHIEISQGIDLKFDVEKISHIGDAAHDSYENQRHRQCLINTRVDLLREITDWATGNSSQYIFWLRGRAGTGKSTIALTIATNLKNQGATLASFFFKRGGGDLARSRKVISTLVFQLATQSRLFGSFVCDALREHPSLGDSASLSKQFDELLLQPLQRIQNSATGMLSFVVVLDALDECDDFRDVCLLLGRLGDNQKMSSLGLRVLVTSRPEIPIRLGFHEMKHVAYHELALHDVPRATVDQDIQRFVTYELAQIRADPHRNLPNSWPGDEKIRIITTRADGLFIYAATVCRYVNGPRQVSASRLEQVCQGSVTKHKSTDELDEMYLMVLDSSMKDDFSVDEAREVTLRLRQVVGSVAVLFDNLSAEELGRLLFVNASAGGVTVQETLDSLHAVFGVPEDPSEPIQMLHLSFRDFLVDSARCPDVRFQIDQQQVHHDLLDRCLDLMKRSLRKNVCQLSKQGRLVDDVSEATLSQYLPLGLRYACCHWTSHAEQGRVCLSDNGLVHNFLRQFCPYWIEVMGLIRKIPEATIMMIQVKSLIKPSEAPEVLLLVQDALRFMLTFNYVLTEAPMQLYNAGLLFSPSNSIFRKAFSSEASTDLGVIAQLPSEWNACTYTLEGHSSWVNSVVFSPNGSRVASGSWDNTVRVWDVQTGQCQHTLKGHSGPISSMAFSPNGLRIASSSWDNTVRLWDMQTGQCQYTLEGHFGRVSSVVFSPDGSQIASSSWDGTVRVWDVQTGQSQCQHTLKGHSDRVNSVVFSSDGSQVASGSDDNAVRLWDVQTGQCQYTLEGQSNGVSSVVFSSDGSRIASSSSDMVVWVWDVQTGQYQYTLEGHSDRVTSVMFSPDGLRLASGSWDNTVRVWDVRTGQCQHTLKGHSNGISSVMFSPSGSQVGSSSDDNTVRVWDVQTGQCQYTLEGHSDRVTSVMFSPDKSQVASGSWDNTVRVWDVQTGQGQCQHALEGHSNRVNSVVFSPNGLQAASSSENTVRVWDVKAGQCQHTLEGHSDRVSSIMFSPDGLRVASSSWDNTVRVWNVQTGQCQYTLKGHSDGVSSILFSPDGSQMASSSLDKMVRVWDVQTGQCQYTLKGHSDRVSSVVFSPDGSQIASSSWDNTVRVWDVQTGQSQYQHTLEGHSNRVNSVVFSPDGSQVASGSDDNTVRLWDVQTGQCQYTLEGHSSRVASVMFSPDKSWVASGSWDNTVRVWDVASWKEILCYDAGTYQQYIEFSDDSSNILVNGNLLSIPLKTRFPSTTARTPGALPKLPLSKLGIKGDWITLSSQKILWLPPEYRPVAWASKNNTIIIGSGTGRVTFVRFAATHTPSL